MIYRFGILVLLLVFLFPYESKAEANPNDQFNGDQILYELSYAADFELDFVARLTTFCTGAAAPFIVARFPNPSFQVKRKLLRFKFGFISKNPYTGTHFSEDKADFRRPSRAAEIAAQKVTDVANSSGSRDYLCDAYLWDAFEDYANAQLELVKYAIEVLDKKNRLSDLADLRSEVEPQFSRIQKLVNGDPNTTRMWAFDLNSTSPK